MSEQAKQILRAAGYAAVAHQYQKRKYTNYPYIIHPVEVGQILLEAEQETDVVVAGILHDVVEDTPVTILEIRRIFGNSVAELVSQVTKISTSLDGNRAIRKELDRKHFASASKNGQTIKLADIISNTKGVSYLNYSFAKIYVPEQRELAVSLERGNEFLRSKALEIIRSEKFILRKLENDR